MGGLQERIANLRPVECQLNDLGSVVSFSGSEAKPQPQSHFAALYALKRIRLQQFWFFGQHCNLQ